MIPRVTAEQLRTQGYEAVMAADVGMKQKTDPEHLAYATENGYIMVTFDRPFAGKTSKSTDHGGLICLSDRQNDVGLMVRTLSEFADNYKREDVIGQVFWF